MDPFRFAQNSDFLSKMVETKSRVIWKGQKIATLFLTNLAIKNAKMYWTQLSNTQGKIKCQDA